MGKKEWLARLLTSTGGARLLRRHVQPDLVILVYHRVFDVPDEGKFPCDLELVSASTAEFRRQMEHVKTHWKPVSLGAVVDALDAGQPLPQGSVAITFDDGHVDNYTHAFPVLRDLGLPATIFLATDYIDSDRQFWFDRVVTLLLGAPPGLLRLARLDTTVNLVDTASRRAAADQVLGLLKRVPNAQRCAVLADLEALIDLPLRSDPMPSGALTWVQVAEMAHHQIDFGSHTVTHPVLSTLDAADMADELQTSRQIIASALGRPCDLLAYPVGKGYAFNDTVKQAARGAGYRAAFSYTDRVDEWASMDRFNINRVSVERYYSQAHIEARMLFPSWFL